MAAEYVFAAGNHEVVLVNIVGNIKPEQIAMLACCRIGPLTRRSLAGCWTGQANIHRAPRRVSDIADAPVAAFPPSVREIMSAYRLGILREAPRQFGGTELSHDYATSRSAIRATG